MFIGHGVLAFVIVAWLARALDLPVRQAAALGVLAAAFGTLPDVDMLYAPLGLLSGVGSVAGASAAFWETAATVHRTATHSLVVGALATVAVAFWQPWTLRAVGRNPTAGLSSLIPAGIAALLVLVAAETGGVVGALIVAVFLAGAFGLATLALRADLPRRWIVVGAGVGLLSHPFGDLLTGTPPGFLYPFDVTLIDGRIVLASDPTVNLLAVFFVELAVIWLGLYTVARLQGWRLGWRVHPGATLGVGYAPILVAVPAPSIDAAAPFVVTVLAVGLVGAPLAVRNRAGRWWDVAVTATSAVTVAGLAYLLAYLVV